MSRCAICGNEPDEHGWQKCKVCGGLFCDRCVGIWASDLKAIEQKYFSWNNKFEDDKKDAIDQSLICNNCIAKSRINDRIVEDVYKYWRK